jgi:thiamine transporter ThiT
MKEIKKFNWINEVIFALFFFLMFIVVAFPLLEVTYTINDATTSLGTISFADVLIGNKVALQGISLNLSNSLWLLPLIICSYFICGLSMFIGTLYKNHDENRNANIAYGISLGFLYLSLFLLLFASFIIPIVDDFYTSISGSISIDYVSGNGNNNVAIIAIVFTLIMSIMVFGKIFESNKFTVTEITEIAVLVALAVVLDKFARIPIQANGGSISFSAVPLFIIGIRHGGFKSFIASSLIFGFITCLLDGYGFATYPFDYFVALSGYCFVGIFFNFAKKHFVDGKDLSTSKTFGIYFTAILLSGLPVMIVRYIGHIISGTILYQPITFLDNFIYQSTYVPASVWCSIGATLVLLEPILLIQRAFPTKKNKIVG